jgi:hypothetical protein
LAATLSAGLWSAPEAHAAPSERAAPSFVGEPELETAKGAALLSWGGDEEDRGGQREYELQEASDAGFSDPVARYRGTSTSWYLSGRLDGTSYFRVRSRERDSSGELGPWSAWSDPQVLHVAHHDPRLALLLLCLGAVVFTTTAVSLLVAARKVEAPK